MERPILAVDHVEKRYGQVAAVRDCTLAVEAGDIFGFIGHNGAGKTTLIRAIVGAQPVTAGRIEVCGIDVARNPVAAKRQLAYVPDNPDVYEFMTGAQYLTFMADVFEVEDSVRRARIGELADRLELTGALGALAGTYSHGMRQKLVLVGALLHDPALLVLDEPFVGLDPSASHELKELLRERAEAGGAVFFSSHVLEVVERLCSRVGIIRAGELVACGATDEVCGADSLEEVFLDLVDDEAARGDGSGRGGNGERSRDAGHGGSRGRAGRPGKFDRAGNVGGR